ncbi:hypothetical protein HYU20_01825 [Candidatus Woesearchaeota archaeon]|nr:hypothetical protein [Candidatus Woesearchaeota archaeon]
MGNFNRLIKKLKEADILLVSEKGFKHAINRAFGRSRWHHVMLYVGKGKVIEATPKKGCHISKLDLNKECYKAYKALRHRKITGKERKEMAAYAVRMFLGRRFNWKHLPRVFLRRSVWLLGNNGQACKPGYKCDNNALICSNIVAVAYHISGRRISRKWAPEYVMPRDYDKAEGFKTIFDVNAEKERQK